MYARRVAQLCNMSAPSRLVSFCLLSSVVCLNQKVTLSQIDYLCPSLSENSTISLSSLLGVGGAGNVVAGKIGEVKVAFKSSKTRSGEARQKLENTGRVLSELNRRGIVDEPKIYFKGVISGNGDVKHIFGADASQVYVVAMTRLGADLEQLCLPGGGVTKCTALDGLLVGAQLLSKLRRIHESGWFYGDGKPENFVTGAAAEGRDNEVFLIDFERAEPLAKTPTLKKHPGGGVRVCSRHAHSRWPSYGDDVETLAYSMVLIAKGHLPWNNRNGDRAKDLKFTRTPEQIASRLAKAYADFVREAQRAGDVYGKLPNYKKLHKILVDGITEIANENFMSLDDLKYSWQKETGKPVAIPQLN